MESGDRELLVVTLEQLASSHDGAELTKALDDFGFAELLAASPRDAVASLFTAMGRAGSMSAAIQDVLARPLAGMTSDAAGCSVVLPAIGQPAAGQLTNGTLTLRGLMLGQRPAGSLLAAVATAGGTAWVRLAAADRPATRVVSGLDPALGMTEIATTSPAGTRQDVVLAGEEAAVRWRAVVAAGRRALACQIAGAVSRMIELAVGHARDRVQFGHAVGSFQAVRHRLADAFVASEAAAAALELAWTADDEQLAAMLAKSLAGRAARIAAAQCQQVLAGVGFTAEHPFHHYLARTMVLDRVLGSAAELPAEIGARLASAGSIPRLVEL
jgi:hypothetical protein